MKSFQIAILAAGMALAACGDKQSPATSVESAAPLQGAEEQATVSGQAMPEVADATPGSGDGGEPAAVTGGADLARGEAVFGKYCVACHGAGVAGAPKLDDKANWESRIAQGMETLNSHALKGFQGKNGYMPPKGGFANLADDEVGAAVAYMVSKSQ